jgi:hypothetical protein
MLNARAIYRLLIDDEQPASPAVPIPSAQPVPETTPDDALDIKGELLRYADEPFNVPGTGPTRQYEHLLLLLRGRTTKRIENNTYVLNRGDHLALRLHATDIIVAYPDGRTVIDTNGYHTNTTRDRLRYLQGGWHVFQQAGTWYWYNSATRTAAEHGGQDRLLPFTDGDTIMPDGSLKMKAFPLYPKRRKRRGT